MFLNIFKIFLIIFTMANLAIPIYEERRNLGFIFSIWKRFRFGMLLEVLLLIILAIASAYTLVNIPFLKYGWFNLFFGDTGSLLGLPVTEGMSSSNLLLRLVMFFYFLLFILAIPFLARIEENIFRRGCITFKEISWQSVKFGLMHLVLGIPLAAAIALIGVGFFYAYKYKKAFNQTLKRMGWTQTEEGGVLAPDKIVHDYLLIELGWTKAEEEGVLASTTYHSFMNTILIVILFIIVLITIF